MRGRGEGSLTKRTITRADGTTYKRWQAVVSMGRDIDGKPKRVHGPLRATRDEAKADLSTFRASAALGVAPDRQRLDDYLRQWLEARSLHLKTRTVRTYRSDIENHIIPELGGLRLNEIMPAHISTFLDSRLRASVSVARKCRATLHAALEFAVRQERITRNPVAVTDAPRAPRADLERWQPKHAKAFAKAARLHRDGPIFLLILATGLRAGEALGLMWDDLEGDVLAVKRQLLTVGPPQLDTPKTVKSVRKLRLGSDVMDMLSDHRMALELEGLLDERDVPRVDGTMVTGALMFPDPEGRPWRLDVLRNRYKAMLTAAEVPPVRIHDLRHYHLSRLIDLGVDPATVSRKAGHSRTSTTMDIYVEAFEDNLALSSFTLEELVGE